MGIKKKVMAAILTAVVVVSSTMSAWAAAPSPTKAPLPATGTKNKSFRADDSGLDYNRQDHINKVVVTKVTPMTKNPANAKAILKTVKADSKGEKREGVVFSWARNADNRAVNITQIGDGTHGIFNSKAGRRVKRVRVASKAKRVTFVKYAFKKSKIKKIVLQSKRVTFNKNVFKGTGQKNVLIRVSGAKNKASNYSFRKGAFNGLSKKSKVVVNKKTLTNKEFKKLKKKLKNAGFKGKIVRK